MATRKSSIKDLMDPKRDEVRVLVAGLTEREARFVCEHRGYSLRIVKRDNDPCPADRGYVPDRLNVEILQGRVVSSHFG